MLLFLGGPCVCCCRSVFSVRCYVSCLTVIYLFLVCCSFCLLRGYSVEIHCNLFQEPVDCIVLGAATIVLPRMYCCGALFSSVKHIHSSLHFPPRCVYSSCRRGFVVFLQGYSAMSCWYPSIIDELDITDCHVHHHTQRLGRVYAYCGILLRVVGAARA